VQKYSHGSLTERTERMITIKDDVIAKLKSFLLGYDNAIFAFLFGSYAEGSVTRDSDLDIAIFFNSRPDIYMRNELRGELEKMLGKTADLVALNDASPVIRMQVLRKGILLVNKYPMVYNEFFVNTIKEYYDLKQNRKQIEENIFKGRIYA